MANNSKLDKKKLEFFKKRLLELKVQFEGDIKQMTSASQNSQAETSDSGHALHMADVASDMYDKEFNLGLASKDRKVLTLIDNALKRIEEGTYGICLGTGKPITIERLKAIPYAEYCLEYQEELESKQ